MEMDLLRLEGKEEGRAVSGRAFDTNAPAMQPHDPLSGGKAHPSSAELFGPVKSFEGLEDLACVTHVDADTTIADEVFTVFLTDPDVSAAG